MDQSSYACSDNHNLYELYNKMQDNIYLSELQLCFFCSLSSSLSVVVFREPAAVHDLLSTDLQPGRVTDYMVHTEETSAAYRVRHQPLELKWSKVVSKQTPLLLLCCSHQVFISPLTVDA